MGNTLLETIRQRRTVYAFKPDPVPESLLAQALEAAIWAPNHYLTEPWRFYVIGPNTREQLAERYATLRANKRQQPGTEAWQQVYQQALARFDAIPGMVLVGQALAEDPMQQEEDYAAVCCAIQNFQLAMWAQGVGVQWSTGSLIRDPETYAITGTSEATLRWVGILYYGYPECVPKSKRTPWQDKTTWLP